MAKKMSNYSGSKHESGEIHGGPKGAGELGCGDPGKAAMRVKPRMSGLPFEGGKNSFKPKSMSKYTQE